MRAFRFLLVLGCLGLATTADAVLAPAKGSQIVALAAGGPCAIPGHPNATGYNIRVGGDGALTPFTVPPKQILVLTEVVASTSFQPAGEVFFVNLLVGNAASSNFLTASFETVPASGAFSVTYAPSNGMVVKAGSTVCVEMSDTDHPTAFVGVLSFAHGFLAPDK
jgi:hypothetical protein